ncbi:MoaD/ThiS family protein [Candidatus Micrarchaeota archaeon]|nr:MoaD/ThiS family protein [Candidatus Micrarchaeota archaeon]
MQLIIDNQKTETEFSGNLSALLKKMNLMREEVVVKVNGKLAPDSKVVGPSDSVEIIKVVFGG